MWHTRVVYLRFGILCLVIAGAPDFTLGLRDVSVTVPTAVRRGDNALLICNYDIEGDTLYSVKWYKGRREFYRYTPKENPAMKTFPVPGITVERSLSNQSHVVLTAVPISISGKFSCEVSVDAPSFYTMIVSGDMEVVEIPEQRPSITGIHSRYRLGDIINGNCSSLYSKPAANLTWTINDIPAPLTHLKMYNIVKNPDDNLESSVVEINFMVTHQHFIRGRLRLKCIARIHDIYEQDIEKSIEEDRPRILASGRSPDANLFPFDQQADGELTDQNELYLTHYRDMASSGSSSLLVRIKRTKTINKTSASATTSTLLTTGWSIIVATINTFDMIFYTTIILSILVTNDLFNLVRNYSNLTRYHNNNCNSGCDNSIHNGENNMNNNNNDIINNNSNNNQQKQQQQKQQFTPWPTKAIKTTTKIINYYENFSRIHPETIIKQDDIALLSLSLSTLSTKSGKHMFTRSTIKDINTKNRNSHCGVNNELKCSSS